MSHRENRPLSDELAIFEDHLEEWRKTHMGEFVLIKGGDVIGFFGSLPEAFTEGTKKYGLREFFIKQITPPDSVNVSLIGQRVLAN